MVRRLVNFFHREFSGLHEAAFLLGVSALLSQILALVRDRLLAASFGAGPELDVYYTAFRVPDILFVTIASFVSVTVLIPFLIQRLEKGEKETARYFLNQVFSVFCAVMVVASVVLFFLAPLLARFIAPGFSPELQAKLIVLMRILLLSPFLLGLSNLFGSVTQSLGYFFIYALSPVVYNLGIIIGIVFFYPIFGLAGLAWGVVLGAAFHGAIQLPTLWRAKLLPVFTARWQKKELADVIKISLPRTLALATQQLCLLVFVAFASKLVSGSVTVFNLALNLQSVPLAIVGVSYSVAAFPALAKTYAGGNKDDFVRQMEAAVRHILFWSTIATAFFIVLRAQLVRVILGSGRFDWQDTRRTAAALALFSISIAAQSLVLLFVRGYYATGKTKKPLTINILSSFIIIGTGLVTMFLFNHFDWWRNLVNTALRVNDIPGTAVLMLPLAFSLGAIANAYIHWVHFVKDFGAFSNAVWRSFTQSVVGAFGGAVAAYGVLDFIGAAWPLTSFLAVFTQGLIAGMVGLVVTGGLLWLVGSEELMEASRAIHHKFWLVATISPDPEEL